MSAENPCFPRIAKKIFGFQARMRINFLLVCPRNPTIRNLTPLWMAVSFADRIIVAVIVDLPDLQRHL